MTIWKTALAPPGRPDVRWHHVAWATAPTAQRLKSLARSRGLSMNKLVEQMSAHALSAWDTENHFRAMAATGDVQKALAVLDRLDALDGEPASD